MKEILRNRDRLPEYASDFRRLSPEVVLDMFAMNEQHARDLMTTFTGIARRMVVASSVDVYWSFGRVNKLEVGEVDPSPITENSPLRTRLYPFRGETLRPQDDPQSSRDHYDKILVERVVLNHPELSGTVLRLPAVYGPHDPNHRMFRYLKRMLDGREAILLDEREASWRLTHGMSTPMPSHWQWPTLGPVAGSTTSANHPPLASPSVLDRLRKRPTGMDASSPCPLSEYLRSCAGRASIQLKISWSILAASAKNSAMASTSIKPRPSGAPSPGNATTSRK